QLLGSTCLCNNGTNDKLNPPTCVADITNPSCFAIQVLTCFGNSNNQALTCDSSLHRILNNNNICVCRSEFYEDSYFTCQECNPSCKTCNESTNSNCLTCDAAKNRVAVINASNQCPCITNYNDKLNFDEACVADITTCHYSCLTCYGIANNQCLTCPLSSFRTLNADLCECNSTYGDAGQAVCVLCHSSCLTCNGTQDNQCLSCDSALDRTLNGSTCPCSSGYNSLANSGVCTINYSPCHYSCDSCFGALANQCMGCGLLSSFHRVYQTDNTCPCDNNYIEQNSQQICIQLYSPCHFSCNQCIGSTLNDCANCPLNSNRTFNFGQCQCNSGYNDAANQQMCQLNYTPCDITCATCFGETSTQCLTCQSPLIMISGQCLCPVITNVFINNSCYPLITPCHYSCQTCINNLSTGCYQCSADRTILPTTGTNRVCNCIDGYFEDAAKSNICSLCHQSCLTCQTTQQNCLTCSLQSFRYFIKNTCPCILNYNDYLDQQNTCVKDLDICHYSCQTCFGQENYQCITCPSQSQRSLFQFQCNCADGYFDNNQTLCKQCNFKCLQCEQQYYNCTQCNKDHFRYLSINKCICLDGYYDNDEPICQTCHEDCQNCDQNQCLKCKSDQRLLINGQCLCYDGYYLKDKKCYLCENQCLTCASFPNFQCLTCGINRMLINNQCVCKEGYFNYQQDCLNCSIKEGKQYKECQYLNFNDGVWTPGENCDDGNMIPRDGCTDLNIDNGYQCDNKLLMPSICYKCPVNCLKCANNNNIIFCIDCIQNYFENQNYCSKCYDENCMQCFNYAYCTKCFYNIQPNNGKCQMCDQGYKQQGKQCLSICGDGILTKEEQCDDNNQYNNDGCSSKCIIEQGYICNPQCRQESNDIKAKLIKSGSQTNNIQIEILNYIFDLTQLEIIIDLFSIDLDYQFNISSINQNKFEIQFLFNKPIKSFNIIHVYIPIKQNQRFLEYIVREIQVIPEEADYYDSTQQTQRQTIKKTQQQFYESLLYIGPIAFLLGGTSFFIQILDILSWINNFYYINVNYPGNVQIFFQQSNWGLIFSIPSFIQFQIQDDSLLPQKFQDKGVDGLILNNIQQTLLLLMVIICCVPLSKSTLTFIKWYFSKNQKKRINIRIENDLMLASSQLNMSTSQLQQSPKLNYLIRALSNQLSNFHQNRYAIILKTVNINILDLILSIVINLKYSNYFNEVIQVICLISCLIMIIFCMAYFYSLYLIAYLNQTLFRMKLFNNLSNPLFEGIKSDRISRFYGFQSMFQKSLFIIFIVLFFEKPLQQTLFCSSVLSGLIIVASYQNPFRNKKHLLAQFIPDLLLSIILLLSTLLAADEQFNRLSFQGRYNIGWIILGLIGISILIQILFILKEAMQQILIKLNWIKSIVL
ncbi:hypothetical protein pb186bvf_014837, partial [Paramecium bursaria]